MGRLHALIVTMWTIRYNGGHVGASLCMSLLYHYAWVERCRIWQALVWGFVGCLGAHRPLISAVQLLTAG